LISPLKPTLLSLLLHASALGALYWLPTLPSERFSAGGRRQIVALQATINRVATYDLAASVAKPPPRSIDPPDQLQPATGDTRLRLENRALRHDPVSLPQPEWPQVDVSRPDELQRRSTELKPSGLLTQDRRPSRTPQTSRLDATSAVVTATESTIGLKESTVAEFRNNPAPKYPLEAVRNRWEGVVLLRLVVAKTGRVRDVQVIESSGFAVLDQAAIEAVRRWQGRPARRWGRAVESVERLPIRFRL